MINVKRSIPYAKRFCHIYKQNYVPSSQIAERLIKGVIYNEKGEGKYVYNKLNKLII